MTSPATGLQYQAGVSSLLWTEPSGSIKEASREKKSSIHEVPPPVGLLISNSVWRMGCHFLSGLVTDKLPVLQ